MMGQCAVRHKASGEPDRFILRGGADDADFELLSAEEEQTLALAIARGDQRARNRMITANLRLVIKIARCYEGHGLSVEDLVGEGNLGLIRAAVEYDPAYNVRFSTYAAHWIKQAIRFALTNTTATIRLPSHINGLMTRWHRVEHQLRRDQGTAPTAEQVADRLGLTESQREMIARGFRARKLRQEGGDGDDAWNPDDAADDRDADPGSHLNAIDETAALNRRLAMLDDRERAIVAMRFGLDDEPPRTLKEVGEILGITREWVRKIEIRALAKLSAAAADEATETPPKTTSRPSPPRRRRPTEKPVDVIATPNARRRMAAVAPAAVSYQARA